jgi:uncharacterized protein YkwD
MLWLWFALVLFLLARPPLLLFWHYGLHPLAEEQGPGEARPAEQMRLPAVPQALGEAWPANPARAAEVAARLSPLEQGIFDASNHQRGQLSRSALRVNAELAGVAAYHSRRMRDEGFFAHASPDGAGPADRAGKALRRTFGTVAENIAKMTDRPGLAEEFVDGWMNSPGHRRNLLEAGRTDLGVGCAEPAAGDKESWFHCAQLFMTVYANLRQAVPDSVAAGQRQDVEVLPENGNPAPVKLRQTNVQTGAVAAEADLHGQSGGAAGQWVAQGPAGVYRLELAIPDGNTPGRFLLVPGPYVTVSP